MKLKYTNNFKKKYSKLSARKKKTLKKQLKFLSKDQFYPSLKTKKNYSLSKAYGMKVELIKNIDLHGYMMVKILSYY